MKTKKTFHPIPEIDEQLFANMRGHYVSQNERIFFETMERKEQQEPGYRTDWLIVESENEDEVAIIRENYDEYSIERTSNSPRPGEYFQSLAEALAFDLYNIEIGRHITLWQWLRERDYAGIRYDRDLDLE